MRTPPFLEPSHFALYFGIFAILHFVLAEKIKTKVIIILLTCILALLFPNLTLFMYALLMFFLLLKLRNAFVLMFITLTILLALIYLDLSYFSNRISDANNLSLLVYMQGWELIFNILNNHFFGVGSQNLVALPLSESGIILADFGLELNRKDGSFLASKIIGETGWLGLVLILYFTRLMTKAFFYIRYNMNNKPSLFLIANSLIYSVSIEFFVRGVAYFSPSFFIFILALFTYQATKNAK